MLLAMLAAAVLQSEPAPPENAVQVAARNTRGNWPSDDKSPARWLVNVPAGKRPFLVAWSSSWGYQIAVRYDYNFDQTRPVAERVYFIAMRQTAERLEEADSRHCAFAESMDELRTLPAPEVIVPGTLPLQGLANPVLAHQNSAITVFGARQKNGDPADVTWSSPGGDIAPWVQPLYERTRYCWTPMT